MLEEFNGGKLLRGMYAQKLHLLNQFHSKGMIPGWDFESLKDDVTYQTFIKKLVGWLIDELVEVSNEYNSLIELLLQHDTSDQGLEKKVNELVLELMDVMQFFIELLCFSDIGPTDIEEYYKALFTEINIPLAWDEGMSATLYYGRHVNVFDSPAIREDTTLSKHIKIYGDDRVPIGPEMGIHIDNDLWFLTKNLSGATRYLKNKEWSVQIRPTDVIPYKRAIMKAWLYFGKVLDLLKLSPKTVYYFYDQTTKKIQTRLDHGY